MVGHTLLKAHYLSQSLSQRAGEDVTTQCDCGQGPQDTEHILLECPLLTLERNTMIEEIRNNVLRAKDCSINRISIELLLGDDDSIPTKVKVAVRKTLLKFLSATLPKFQI